MKSSLPPGLRRQLRAYRLAYGAIAVAESLCLAALLMALAHPPAVFLALLWLGARSGRWPTHRRIAALAAARDPRLGEPVRAAVELAESTDPPSMRGSPDLIAQLLAEADQRAAGVNFARFVSIRPLLALVVAVLAVNVALSARRQRVSERPVPPLAAGSNPPPSAVTSPAPRRERLEKLAAALREISAEVRRALQPHVRSLDGAVEKERRAAAALDRGEVSEAQALTEQVADQLSEFARLAGAVPALRELSAEADALARDYGASASAIVLLNPVASPTPVLGTSSVPPSVTVVMATAPLPAVAPGGQPWAPPAHVDPGAHGHEPLPADYEQPIRKYFERLANQLP